MNMSRYRKTFDQFPSLFERLTPKVHRIPGGLISEILLYTVEANPLNQVNLMFVCRR
jgi:hypothetical protein